MTPPASAVARCSVVRVRAWAPGITTPEEWQDWARDGREFARDGAPRLEWMPALQRRHVDRLGRLACEAAFQALAGEMGVPVVYCSRFGEVERSVDLLTTLARGEPLSPTSFSLSVHNAASGLLAISRRETATTIALSAGEASAASGFIEASSLLDDGAHRVLVVVADCPLPSPYESFADTTPAAFAWACLVEPPREHVVSVVCGPRTARADNLQKPAALAVLRFLLGSDSELLHEADRHHWHWRRGA